MSADLPDRSLNEDLHYRKERADTPLVFEDLYEQYLARADEERDRRVEEELLAGSDK